MVMLVPDRDDRKWVACALAASVLHGTRHPSSTVLNPIGFCQPKGLMAIGLQFIRLLPETVVPGEAGGTVSHDFFRSSHPHLAWLGAGETRIEQGAFSTGPPPA